MLLFISGRFHRINVQQLFAKKGGLYNLFFRVPKLKQNKGLRNMEVSN